MNKASKANKVTFSKKATEKMPGLFRIFFYFILFNNFVTNGLFKETVSNIQKTTRFNSKIRKTLLNYRKENQIFGKKEIDSLLNFDRLEGYFLNSEKKSPRILQSCSSSLFWDPNTLTCVTKCSGCGDKTTQQCITKCPDGSFCNPYDTTCSTCYTGCKTCSGVAPAQCSECFPPRIQSIYDKTCNIDNCGKYYYLNFTDRVCYPCWKPCYVCIDQDICNACETPDYAPYNPAKICVLYAECVGNRYTDGKCNDCIFPCLNCASATSCTTCVESYFLMNSNCITPCPANYYHDLILRKCVTTCPTNTYADPIDFLCKTCHQTCLTCEGSTENKCLTCKYGDWAFLNGICFPPDNYVVLQRLMNDDKFGSDRNLGKVSFTPTGLIFSDCEKYRMVGGYKIFNRALDLEYYFNLPPAYYKVHYQAMALVVDSTLYTGSLKILLNSQLIESYKNSDLPTITLKCGNYYDDVYQWFNKMITTSSSDLKVVFSNERIIGNGWGITDLIIAVLACHVSCKSCSGPLSNNCLSCYPNAVLTSESKCECSGTSKLIELRGTGEKCLISPCAYCEFKGTCSPECETCFGPLNTDCLKCKSPNVLQDKLCQASCNSNYYLLDDRKVCVKLCPNEGYKEDVASFSCKKCSPKCKLCSLSESFCLECQSGYLYNAVCYDLCPEGTFTYEKNRIKKCLPCSSSCIACSIDAYTCSACQSGFLLQGNSCQTSCNSGFLNLKNVCVESCPVENFFADPLAQECRVCDSSCLTCDGALSANCQSCPANRYFLNNKCNLNVCGDGRKFDTEECDDGNILDGDGCNSNCLSEVNYFCYGGTKSGSDTCKSCSSGCSKCQNENTCLQCSVNFFRFTLGNSSTVCLSACPETVYYPNTSLNSCEKCDISCLTCFGNDAKSCFKCQTGFFLFATQCSVDCPANNYKELSNNTCQSCVSPCFNCTNPTKCLSCVENFELVIETGQCKVCGNGTLYELQTRSCRHCHNTCKNCKGGYTAENCIECFEDSYFKLGFCQPHECGDGIRWGSEVCDDGNIINGDGCNDACQKEEGFVCKKIGEGDHCESCGEHCLKCDTAKKCLNCEPNYFFEKTNEEILCKSICKEGNYPNDQHICSPCNDFCKQCSNPIDCVNCITGHYLFLKTCLSSCPQGHYGESGLCIPCVSPCVECSTSSICTHCDQGYFINISNECEKCSDYCLTCESSTTCSHCAENHSLFEGLCKKTVCSKGEYKPLGMEICEKCQEFCSSCVGPSIENCTECSAGRTLNKELGCVVCTNTTVFFLDSSGTCQEICGKGYLVTNKLECDDGNRESGDGCSSECKLEKGFNCTTDDNKLVCNRTEGPDLKLTLINVEEILLEFSEPVRFIAEIREIFDVSLRPAVNNNFFAYSFGVLDNSNSSLRLRLKYKATLRGITLVIYILNYSYVTNFNNTPIRNKLFEIKLSDYLYQDSLSETVNDAGAIVVKTSQIAVGTMSLGLIQTNSINMLFQILDIGQIIYYMRFLEIAYPSNLCRFLKDLSGFSLGFVPNFWNLKIRGKTIKERLELNTSDIQSPKSFLNNDMTSFFFFNISEEFFIVFFVLVLDITLLISYKIVPAKFEKLKARLRLFVDLFRWNVWIRTWQTIYLDTCVSAFLQYQNLSFSKPALILSSIFSLVASLFILGYPVYVIRTLNKNKGNIQELVSVRKYGELYTSMHCRTTLSLNFQGLIIIRKFCHAAITVLLHSNVVLLLILILFTNVIYLALLIKSKPHRNSAENNKSLLVEILLTLIYVLLIPLISENSLDEYVREYIGWTIISLIMVIMGFHFFFVIKEQNRASKIWLRRYCGSGIPENQDFNRAQSTFLDNKTLLRYIRPTIVKIGLPTTHRKFSEAKRDTIEPNMLSSSVRDSYNKIQASTSRLDRKSNAKMEELQSPTLKFDKNIVELRDSLHKSIRPSMARLSRLGKPQSSADN